MWALVKKDRVVKIQEKPSSISVSVSKFRDYKWIKIIEGDSATIGDVYFGGAFHQAQEVEVDGVSYYKFVSLPKIQTYYANSSLMYTKAASLSASNLESGIYKINLSYNWSIDSTSSDFLAKIVHKNHKGEDVIIYEHQQEAKEAGGYYFNTRTDQKYVATWFKPLILEGNNTFDLYFGSNNKKRWTSIWNIVLDLEGKG